MVDRRCATIIVVRLAHTLFRAAWILRSVCVSRADVASSSKTMAGAFKIVLAENANFLLEISISHNFKKQKLNISKLLS